ncbi:MAG: Calx-beta domain-containing protein [Cyanobium sp.]
MTFTAGGTATSGVDYAPVGTTVNFAPGEATASLAITPTADSEMEADETIEILLSPGSGYSVGTSGAVNGTILNDDFPLITLAVAPASVDENSATAMVYTFTRSGPTTSALTVSYGVEGTATMGVDYSGIPGSVTPNTLTFASGASTATLAVTPIGDTTVEANETVALRLLSGNGYSVGTGSAVVATIRNDDLPGVTLAVSPAAVAEASPTNLVFTFTRSVSTADPLTVTYNVAGTASPGVDYTGISTGSGSRTVTIAGGATSAQVIVDPSDDTTVESNETVVLTLATGSGYTVTTTASITGTINNDDSDAPPPVERTP